MSIIATKKSKNQKKNQFELNFYVPQDFDPSVLPENIRDEACYVLSLMRRKWWSWQADAEGWIYLHSKIIEKIIPNAKHWAEIKKWLQVHTDLQIDKGYVKGRRCMGYRITSGYTKWRNVKISNPNLYWKVKNSQSARLTHKIHKHLSKQFDQLEIDMEQAKLIISTMVPKKEALTIEEYREMILAQCQAIQDKEFWCEPDDYGRVHSNLTNLPTELRNSLSVNGKKLVGLDLANSQPLIAGIVCNQYFSSESTRLSFLNQYKTEETHTGEGEIDNSNSSLSCSEELYNSNDSKELDQYSDITNYIKLCEKGLFYESLMTETLTRQQVKTKLYQVWFGKTHWKSEIKSHFEKSHPSVYQMLKEMKSEDYRRSAWILQNYEAMLFIGRIATRIMTEQPDMPIYTLHDALYTTPEHADYFQEVIEAEFANLNVKPTIKRTYHE